VLSVNHVQEEFTDCFTYPKSPRGRTLDSPPFVVQNWAVLMGVVRRREEDDPVGWVVNGEDPINLYP
jgi:hypothetical protein